MHITRFSYLLIVITIGWTLTGCRQATPPTEAVSIGAILPLTGNLSTVGRDVRIALEIAQEDLEGRVPPVTILYEDDAFEPSASVAAFKKFVDIDHVPFVIGPLNGSSIEAVRPLAAESNVIVFTPWGAGNRIDNFILKNSVEADDEARAIAQRMVEGLGLQNPAIVYLQNDWGQVHLKAFRDEVQKLGGTLVLAEPYDFGVTDFRAILTKVKSVSADGLYIVHNGAFVGMITKQAAELGLDIPYFGQYATESSDVIGVGGSSLEGITYTFPIDDAHLTEKQRRFVAAFEERAGGRPQVAAYNAYDIYSIFASALMQCPPHDQVCMQQYMRNLHTYEGVGGIVSFSDGKLHRSFFFKTVRDGQFVPLPL